MNIETTICLVAVIGSVFILLNLLNKSRVIHQWMKPIILIISIIILIIVFIFLYRFNVIGHIPYLDGVEYNKSSETYIPENVTPPQFKSNKDSKLKEAKEELNSTINEFKAPIKN